MHKQHTPIGYDTNLLTVFQAIVELATAEPHSMDEANEILYAIEDKATAQAADLDSPAWDAVKERLAPEQ